MVDNGGKEFDISDEKNILKINSPKDSINGPYKVLYTDIHERWSVVLLQWDGKPRLGMRWFWGSHGEPNSHGYSTWFVIPSELSIAILNGLPLAHDIRIAVENFLCGKVQEDVFTKNG